MGKARSIKTLNGSGSLRLEHVKRRNVIRWVFSGGTRAAHRVEMPVPDFLMELGLSPEPVESPRWYIVFAADGARTYGGAGDFVGSYATEALARTCFREVCQRSPEWAQLVCLDHKGSMALLCWKGEQMRRPRPPYISGVRANPARPA